MWVQQRKQSCVRTAGDIVSTAAAVGIIQYREGTPHRVLLSLRTTAHFCTRNVAVVCLTQGLCVTRVLPGTMYSIQCTGTKHHQQLQERTPTPKYHRYFDPKYSCSCLEKYSIQNIPQLGEFELFFFPKICFYFPPPKYFLKDLPVKTEGECPESLAAVQIFSLEVCTLKKNQKLVVQGNQTKVQ